jgi:hemoglobin
MKNDIQNRADIELLVRSFYDKVKTDDTIGYIFNDIARVNWEKHFPVMFDFWENVLFYTGVYNGNPLIIHQHLNRIVPLKLEHFNQWNKLFTQTVDELFEGNNAMLAKQRALSISTIMQIKILSKVEE